MKKPVKSVMSKVVIGVLTACFGAGSIGCIGAAGSTEEDEQTVTVTAVHLHADGTEQVQETTMTLAQERAESAAREQQLARATVARGSGLGEVEQALSLDTSCFGASLWLYDASNNRICFDGAGFADLYAYPDGSSSWARQVRSFWPGNEAGYLFDRSHDIPNYESFSAWQARTTAVFGDHHDTVVLTN